MENKSNKGNGQPTDPQNDWQNAERNRDHKDENTFDLRSAQANGYGIDNKSFDARDREDQEEEEEEENDEDDTISDWGDYDPLNNGMPSDNDPAAPGSAV